jgi:hypothetical protein
MWQNEMKREALDVKKEQKRIENADRLAKQREENAQNEHIVYGLNYNSLFLRIYDATINHFNNLKLIKAMQFDQKLIIDCSYDDHMNPREASNAGKQLMLCFAENRMHDEPFDLTLCNFDFNSISAKTLHKFIPTIHDADFPMNVYPESMTEKFDKKKLVYLTPHCNNDLVQFNPDDIYIIGAMVDRANNEPLSLAKAKKQGLRMARLPLDRYLNWGSGSGKSLTLNQMVTIMLEMKKHGDWNEALKIVPRRKVIDDEELAMSRKKFGGGFGGGKEREREGFNQRGSYKREGNQREGFTRDNFSRDNQRENRRDSQRDNYNQNSYNRDNFRSKPRYDSHRDFDDNRQKPRQDFSDSRDNYQRKPFDKTRSFKEKQHFDKFKFNLDTWGKKMDKKRNDS